MLQNDIKEREIFIQKRIFAFACPRALYANIKALKGMKFFLLLSKTVHNSKGLLRKTFNKQYSKSVTRNTQFFEILHLTVTQTFMNFIFVFAH